MKFSKMQGCGNDYVYVNCFQEQISDRPAAAIRVSDRHFGIGGDGMICICPSDRADFKMDMYNADGSRSQMCGNGIRCVAKYVYDKGLTDKTTITVESGGEVKTLWLNVENGAVSTVRVCMGKPEFVPAKIPVAAPGESFIQQPVEVLGKTWSVSCVSMGNPHAVVFVDSTKELDLETIGPAFENHPLFPERVNTEFIEVVDEKNLNMRVWERGSGETLACGTGATASLAIAALVGKTGNSATLHLLGGDLFIEWDREADLLYMTGPAAFTFEGETDLV